MARYALEISYDGALFSGWQIQPNQLTVQESLETALSLLNGAVVKVAGAGRTDAGVHARAQVCSFDMLKEWEYRKLILALNANLSKGISAMRIKRVDDSFHARFDAQSREYKYFIWNACSAYPHMLGKVCWLKAGHIYNWEMAKKACAYIEGEHDFGSFCRKCDRPENSIRTIYSAKLRRHGNMITLSVKGNGFLTNMVRIMAGCLERVAKGDMTPEGVGELLENKSADRSECGRTFPPEGLYLWNVNYEPHLW